MAKRKPAAKSGKTVDAVVPPHPRPQLVREGWAKLDGEWDFAIDAAGEIRDRDEVKFTQKIRVPFAPETPASGINDQSFYKAVWYRRRFTPPPLRGGQRLLLHFGAVDYVARVHVNGALMAVHEGGYSPFTVDVTEASQASKRLEIVVHAEDDPHDMAKPRGKQDWLEKPHSIWYARTTGIWQSVWWEVVPERWIEKLRWYADGLNFKIGFEIKVARGGRARQQVRVRLRMGARDLGEITTTVVNGVAAASVQLADPGIGDARHGLYWYPWSPTIIDAEVTLLDGEAVVDRVNSYTALRHIKLQGGRFWLNGAPVRLDLVLDQGYWEESGLTAPDDAALRRDVELTRQMGFNGVRKHQKLEDPRFLYWADHLGLFVWSEFPGCYQFSPEAAARTTRQWLEAMERDVSHPCIIAWVPFNESWGVPDLPDSAPQRALVESLYHLTKAYDPSRPVIGNDGWELSKTDILAIHDYDADPQKLVRRYQDPSHFLYHERPGHKLIALEGYDHAGLPLMLTEFGGIALSKDTGGTWGYSRARSSEDLAGRYARLLDAVRGIPIFGGFCYTQLTDTYQEANGLLWMDRTPKFDLHLMAIATRGPWDEREREMLRKAMEG